MLPASSMLQASPSEVSATDWEGGLLFLRPPPLRARPWNWRFRWPHSGSHQALLEVDSAFPGCLDGWMDGLTRKNRDDRNLRMDAEAGGRSGGAILLLLAVFMLFPITINYLGLRVVGPGWRPLWRAWLAPRSSEEHRVWSELPSRWKMDFVVLNVCIACMATLGAVGVYLEMA